MRKIRLKLMTGICLISCLALMVANASAEVVYFVGAQEMSEGAKLEGYLLTGDWLARKKNEANVAKLTLPVNWPDGTYTIGLNYKDERGGNSSISFRINDTEVSTFKLDQQHAWYWHNAKDVKMKKGDKLTIEAKVDGNEMCYLRKLYVKNKAPEVKLPPVGIPVYASNKPRDLLRDFSQDGYIDEGWCIKNPRENGIGMLSRRSPWPDGNYAVRIKAHDENDGRSTIALKIDDQVVKWWLLDIDDNQPHVLEARGIRINKNDSVTIESYTDDGEFARLYSITVLKDEKAQEPSAVPTKQ